MAKEVWPGTEDEKLALGLAVAHNCGCEKPLGVLVRQGGCHDLLIPNHQAWARLVFARRRAGHLLVEELSPQRRLQPGPPYSNSLINLIYILGSR